MKLAWIAARNRYDMQREDQAGIGYVDYIFYPYNREDDGIIIELNQAPELLALPKVYGFENIIPVGICGGDCQVDFGEIVRRA